MLYKLKKNDLGIRRESIPPRLDVRYPDRMATGRTWPIAVVAERVRRGDPEGAPGIDGMTVDELPEYLRHHWPEIRAQLEAGRYRPQPVKRVEIPKPDGKTRPLGIPTVLDRFIQQAIAQVVSAQWEPHFHRHSYGFRPRRSAHQAVREVQANIRAGHGWVVDMDLQAFFDRVNHDRLMARLKRRCPDAGLLRLVNRFLKAGVSVAGNIEATTMGVPQGGPLSPVLANVVLDELDWELDRELRKRGVTVRDAWNTSKSAHGPWRLSKTPALAFALPLRFFTNLGLPSLAPR